MTQHTTAIKHARKYAHLIDLVQMVDGVAEARPEVVQAKFEQVFTRPVKRILMAFVPHISRDAFVFDSARKGIYPCFRPYGPALLVSVLENHGYTADLVDLHFAILDHVNRVERPDQFDFDVWKVHLADKIARFQPDAIGLSCMCNMGHEPMKEVAHFLKDQYADLPVIAGGVHPSLTAPHILQDVPEIDFIVLHEAENSLLTFLDVANGRGHVGDLASVAFQHQGHVLALSKRDIPQSFDYSPDYKELPIARYSRVGRIGAYTFLRPPDAVASTILSRRGCRAACSFCSVRSVNGQAVRTRDYVPVIDELERLKHRYGVSHVMWLDDDLFWDNDQAVAMFREMAERRLGITWDASNGIIAAALNEQLLQACVDSGCVGFNIGLESGNAEILRHMRKPGTIEKYLKAAKLLHQYPQIFTKGFLIIGYPDETLGAMLDSVNLSLAMECDWYPSQILTPMPGTPVHQYMLDQEQLSGIPSEVLGKGRTFSIGVSGEFRKRERNEMAKTTAYTDPFEGDLARVPTREELTEVWLTMDYRINYEPILGQTDMRKIGKKASMLKEICERMTDNNPLGYLFYGVCLEKLGESTEAGRMIRQAREHLEHSAFWQVRFDGLGIDSVLSEYESKCAVLKH